LLQSLQDEDGLAFLFISHDMAVIEQVADRVMVMRLGQVVEEGVRDAVLHSPRHPYTRRLLSAVPVPDPTRPLPERQAGDASGTPVLPVGQSPEKLILRDLGAGHRAAV